MKFNEINNVPALVSERLIEDCIAIDGADNVNAGTIHLNDCGGFAEFVINTGDLFAAAVEQANVAIC